jgi:hypothetical protein|tara:strand:- start:27 stop:1403 length:1377 start_codon:yes stop_codon:yes gene_type:complete
MSTIDYDLDQDQEILENVLQELESGASEVKEESSDNAAMDKDAAMNDHIHPTPVEKFDNQTTTAEEAKLDRKNDQSASGAYDRMQGRAEKSRYLRLFAFTLVVVVLCMSLPMLGQLWKRSFSDDNFVSLEEVTKSTTGITITVELKACELHIRPFHAPSKATTPSISAVAKQLDLQFGLKNKFSIDKQKKIIVAKSEIIHYLAPYVHCAVDLVVHEDLPLENVHLNISASGPNPSSVSFHESEMSMFGSLTIKGIKLYLGSERKKKSPAKKMFVNIKSGAVNISSVDQALAINITTVFADVMLMASQDALVLDKLQSAFNYYVLAGYCIDKLGCYHLDEQTGGGGKTPRNRELLSENATGLSSGLTLYPEQQELSFSIVHLFLESNSGTFYVAAVNHDALYARQFMLASSKLQPEFDASSQAALQRVVPFIETAPDEDSIIIMDIAGPNIQHAKWMCK